MEKTEGRARRPLARARARACAQPSFHRLSFPLSLLSFSPKVDPAWTAARELAARRGVPLPPPPASATALTPEEAAAAVAAAVASHPLGSRCEVSPGGKRGAVRFVGAVPSLPAGPWVGVEYDEPVGKNDGTPPVAKGASGVGKPPARLFECAPGFGGFVRPASVAVGDFPPVEVDFGSEDEI